MVTIGMNYQVIEGKEEVFEAACKRVLSVMQGDAGHDHSEVYKGLDDNGSYLIVSRWEDEESFEKFIRSDTFKKVTSWGEANVLAGRPSHTTYYEADAPASS